MKRKTRFQLEMLRERAVRPVPVAGLVYSWVVERPRIEAEQGEDAKYGMWMFELGRAKPPFLGLSEKCMRLRIHGELAGHCLAPGLAVILRFNFPNLLDTLPAAYYIVVQENAP